MQYSQADVHWIYVGKHRAAIHKNNTKPGYNVQLAVLIINPQIEDN